jgi:mRNA interferase HigB
MRVIAKRTLVDFWTKHPDSQGQLTAWYAEALKAEWAAPQDIKDTYKTASFLADNRVVFNIKGNSYRLIVRINYDFHIVYIRFVGTHAEYDKINALEV